MPDIEATIGLDARQFHAGLSGVQRAVRGASNMFKLAFGASIAKQAFGAMKDAVEEFAKSNEDARKKVEQWNATAAGIKAGAGEVMVGVFGSIADRIDQMAGGIGQARIADDASKKSMEAVQNKIKGEKDLAASSAKRRADMEFELEMERDRTALDRMKRDGHEEDAAYIAESLAIAKQLRDLSRDENLTLNDRLRLEAEIKRTAGEKQVDAVNRIREEKAAEADKFNRGFDSEFARVDATIQALAGEKELAALTGIRLDYEQKIAEVAAQKTLTEEQKQERINRLVGQRERMLKATVDEQVREAQAAVSGAQSKGGGNYRTVEAGLGFAAGLGIGTVAARSSDDPVKKAVDQVAKVQMQGNAYLKQIADKTGVTVAVAG